MRTGSHARAAKRMGVDRNTVARRVAALEEELGLALFERGPQGWSQTPAGQELAELAGRVEDDVLALARHVDARDPALRGTARLTTVPHLATHLLPPGAPGAAPAPPRALAGGGRRRRGPSTCPAVRPTWRCAWAAPATRGWWRAGSPCWPSPSTRPPPRRPGAAARWTFASIPFLGDEADLLQERWLDKLAPERRVVHRCNSTTSLLAVARQGLGVVMLPCYIGDADPGAAAAGRAGAGPARDLGCSVHGDLRRAPRVRAVIDWLDELVARARPALLGQR